MEKKEYLEIDESKSANPRLDCSTENWVQRPMVYGTPLMSYLKDEKIWATCPYNSTHRIKPNRIQAHLLKCEKVYPKLEICAYDYTHRVPKSEMNNHIANCPSKVVTTHDHTAKSNILLYHPKPRPELEIKPSDPDYECWD